MGARAAPLLECVSRLRLTRPAGCALPDAGVVVVVAVTTGAPSPLLSIFCRLATASSGSTCESKTRPHVHMNALDVRCVKKEQHHRPRVITLAAVMCGGTSSSSSSSSSSSLASMSSSVTDAAGAGTETAFGGGGVSCAFLTGGCGADATLGCVDASAGRAPDCGAGRMGAASAGGRAPSPRRGAGPAPPAVAQAAGAAPGGGASTVLPSMLHTNTNDTCAHGIRTRSTSDTQTAPELRTKPLAPANLSASSGTSALPSWCPHDAKSSSAGLPS